MAAARGAAGRAAEATGVVMVVMVVVVVVVVVVVMVVVEGLGNNLHNRCKSKTCRHAPAHALAQPPLDRSTR